MDKKDRAAIDLLIGLIFLFVGLYVIFQNAIVTSNYTFMLGGYRLNSSLIMIPVILGIIWKVASPKSKLATILIILGLGGLVVGLVLGIRIHFMYTSLINYIIMVATLAIGLGLIVKSMI